MQRRKILLLCSRPANLALLACLEEKSSRALDLLQVVERRESAVWRPGLEFEDSTLQLSLLNDLAFPRKPSSPSTFFSFLREKGLLHQYVRTNNLRTSRNLFSDYLVWVTVEVTGIGFCGHQLGTPRFVAPAIGAVSEMGTDNLVLGLGDEPYIPENLTVDRARRRARTERTLAGLAVWAGVVADALDAGYWSEQPHEQAAYLASSSIFHLEGVAK
jgi:L-ornithine N5-oxygenase